MGHICECGSAVCDKHIELSDSEAEEIYSHEDWAPSPWIIANDCPVGAGPGLALLERRKSYSLYEEVL